MKLGFWKSEEVKNHECRVENEILDCHVESSGKGKLHIDSLLHNF